jgi:hypothetical protein
MFSFAFSDPVANTWARFMSGWVLATGRRTVSGIIPFADPGGVRSHDSYQYLLRKARWFTDSLWWRWTRWLVPLFAPAGRVPLDLDDTLFHKSGRRVAGAAWWRDAVHSTGTRTVYARGLNLVVLTLRVQPPWGGEPVGIPINMRLHRKDGPSLLDLAAEMVTEVAGWFPEREFSLCADGAYASLAGRALPRTAVTSRMRRDAALYEPPPPRQPRQRGRPRKRGARLPPPKELAKRVRNWARLQVEERGHVVERLVFARPVLWYDVCGIQPVLLVLSRDPAGHQPDDFFFTTDTNTTLHLDAVLSTVAGRWSIEDTFRNVKQYLGGEEPQVWQSKGPERAAMLSLLLYGLIWVWFLRHGWQRTTVERSAWYPHKQHPSFQDALAALRRALWAKRIFASSGSTCVPRKIIAVLIHALAVSA